MKAIYYQNPLAFPVTPIHRLAKSFAQHLHFPDPRALYTLMAALVANLANGRPVWLMLIGPPSCGKSELLNSLLSIPRMKEGGSITSLGALLSASRRKERGAFSTGGILRDIGDRGGLIIKEFTSILSLAPDTLRQILAAFREVYDGRYTRSAGSDGGTDQQWAGKMAFLTGCTEAIDHHHSLISDMGERFVFWRYTESEGWAESFQSLSSDESEQLSERLQQLVLTFLDEIGAGWDSPPELEPLNTKDKHRIISYAQFAVRGRSAVIRDSYTREIVHKAGAEYPTRLSQVLALMLRSLRYIGVDEDDCWQIIGKLAVDSIPGARRYVLLALLDNCNSTKRISEQIGISETTTRYALEELVIHGLVERDSSTAAKWVLTDWARTRLSQGAGSIRELRPR